jgi:hypothetical protein
MQQQHQIHVQQFLLLTQQLVRLVRLLHRLGLCGLSHRLRTPLREAIAMPPSP